MHRPQTPVPRSWHQKFPSRFPITTRLPHILSANMATPQTVELAKTLPPRLLRFFQRYPPPQLFPTITSQIAATPTEPAVTETISTTPPVDANAPVIETSAPEIAAVEANFPNPFLPTKNFTTGRWHGPVYGLRKQADLVKLASAHGVVDLLPWTIKKPGEKEARRIERGLTVKGTGEGQRVKGKLWERTLKGRLEMRRQAMLDMPRLIQEWKQVSNSWGKWMWVSVRQLLTVIVERTWSWVEEVAKWEGEEIDGLRRRACTRDVLGLCIFMCLDGRAYCHGVWAGTCPALYHTSRRKCMCTRRARAAQQHISIDHLHFVHGMSECGYPSKTSSLNNPPSLSVNVSTKENARYAVVVSTMSIPSSMPQMPVRITFQSHNHLFVGVHWLLEAVLPCISKCAIVVLHVRDTANILLPEPVTTSTVVHGVCRLVVA